VLGKVRTNPKVRYLSRMRMTADARPGINLIRAYSNGALMVNETPVRASVSVSAETLTLMPELRDIGDLSDEHANAVLGTEPEVVIIGTGNRQVFPAPDWSARFLTRSVGVEVMTTAAACRTYNVLASEHRRVTALLILQ
jgi:uncharacterized protein